MIERIVNNWFWMDRLVVNRSSWRGKMIIFKSIAISWLV